MSQRRMISQHIVSSDAFLEMPASSQTLYFHLAVHADDDGFVQPKMVMRMVNANEDDLKVLITKRFVLAFESGVVVIKHWLIHNLIRADLYKETLHRKEKATLGLNEAGAYTELRDGVFELKAIDVPEWLKRRRKDERTANVPQTARRLGKDRLGKDTLQSELPFTLADEIKKLEDSERRDMNVIALYLEQRKPDIQTKEQFQIALRRHLRPAKALSVFTDDQILKAVEVVKRKHSDVAWTIDTLVKVLTK